VHERSLFEYLKFELAPRSAAQHLTTVELQKDDGFTQAVVERVDRLADSLSGGSGAA
jgi:hypothetical protein